MRSITFKMTVNYDDYVEGLKYTLADLILAGEKITASKIKNYTRNRILNRGGDFAMEMSLFCGEEANAYVMDNEEALELKLKELKIIK